LQYFDFFFFEFATKSFLVVLVAGKDRPPGKKDRKTHGGVWRWRCLLSIARIHLKKKATKKFIE